jgi:hypothetical protein
MAFMIMRMRSSKLLGRDFPSSASFSCLLVRDLLNPFLEMAQRWIF